MHPSLPFGMEFMSDRIGQNVLVYRISGVIMAIHCEPPCPGVNHRVPAWIVVNCVWHAKREREPSCSRPLTSHSHIWPQRASTTFTWPRLKKGGCRCAEKSAGEGRVSWRLGSWGQVGDAKFHSFNSGYRNDCNCTAECVSFRPYCTQLRWPSPR